MNCTLFSQDSMQQSIADTVFISEILFSFWLAFDVAVVNDKLKAKKVGNENP